MDLKSYLRCYDSRARVTRSSRNFFYTSWGPRYVVRSDDKKRARLNAITHLLSQIGYEELPREEVKLPKRQKGGDYQESNHPFRFVPEIY